MKIPGVSQDVILPQGCFRKQLRVTNLCRVLTAHTFDFLKSLKISAQVTQFLPELSIWEPKIAIPGWFGRTTSLNSSRIALKSIAWQFLKWESTIVRLDGFGHSERICTRFVAPNGASWVGEMISERSRRVIALFGTLMSVSQLKSSQPCNTLIL